jgi:hypothetical protein
MMVVLKWRSDVALCVHFLRFKYFDRAGFVLTFLFVGAQRHGAVWLSAASSGALITTTIADFSTIHV